MNKRLNQKGFTLVELLAVLVILVAIMGIAIPTISSSLERTKTKQNESRYKVLETAAEQYVTDHKNAIYSNLDNNSTNSCAIQIGSIDFLTEEEMLDADDNPLNNHYIIFTRPNDNNPSNYEYSEDNQGLNTCI